MWNVGWESLDLPAAFDVKALDEHGVPVPPSAWPPAHAMRGEAIDRKVAIEWSGLGTVWYSIKGKPVISGARERWLVVTIKRIEDPAGSPSHTASVT
jgi:hypothetical protein